MRRFLAVCVAVVCLPLAGQDAANVFTWIGSTGRVLEGNAAVHIRVRAAGTPVLDVTEVTRDGTSLNAGEAFAAAYANGTLTITPKAAAAKPGTYVVHLAVTNEKITEPQPVEVTLTRAAPPTAKKPEPRRATIDVDSSLYVDQIIVLPWPLRVMAKPDSWVVRETGGRYAMTPATSDVTAVIRAKSSTDLGHLRVAFPTVQPGKDAKAKLSIDEKRFWLGSANATVRLQSPVLERVQLYTVVVRSRLAYGWLIGAIVGGIALGWFVKKVLEVRGAVLAAKVAAHEEAERVRALELRIADPGVRRDLLAQRALLESATGTKEAIDKTVTDVKAEVEKIKTKAEEDRTAAKNKLDALRGAVGNPGEQFMPLRSIVSGTATALDAQKSALDRGEIREPLNELARIERSVLGEVREELPRIASDIASALPKFGTWSELAMAAALTSIDTKLGTLNQRPTSVDELKATLNATAEISSLLRYNVGSSGINDVWETVKFVRAELEREGAIDTATREALLAAEKEVREARSDELPREIGKVATAVQHAHEALTRAILAAYRKITPAATDKPEGLDTGAFRKATMAALQKPAKAEDEHAEAALGMERVASFGREAVEPTDLRRLDEGIGAARTAGEIAKSLRLVHGLRDWIYAALVLLGGLIIFHGSFIGTLEDLAAAFLWGFSVDLTAATLTTYTTPLLARRPFRAEDAG